MFGAIDRVIESHPDWNFYRVSCVYPVATISIRIVCEWRHNRSFHDFRGYAVAMVTIQLCLWVT
jgi:hypothetical protein